MSETPLAELITAELIRLQLQAAGRDEAIREMAACLAEAERILSVDDVVTAALAREAEGTTNVGFGVAIPHVKAAAVLRPSLVFARSTAGLPWPAFAESEGATARVDLLFLIAVPEQAADEHLHILARLARALMHEELRTQLRQATTATETVAILRRQLEPE